MCIDEGNQNKAIFFLPSGILGMEGSTKQGVEQHVFYPTPDISQ